MKSNWRILLVLIGVLFVIGVDAYADDDPLPRVEVWSGVSAIASEPSGTLQSVYSPPLLFDGAFVSHASQTIRAESGFGAGFVAGLNVFPFDHIGVQFLFDRVTTQLTGTNGDYSVSLDYVARLPPNDDLQPVSVRHTTKWPDTTGSITHTAIAVNAVVRFGKPSGITITASGGPAVYRVAGQLQPIAYTTFTLGGHSVLFEDDYRLAAEFDPTNVLVVNVGADVSATITRNIALVGGFRYFAAPDVDVSVRPNRVINGPEIGSAQPIGDIVPALHLPPMTMALDGTRIFVGVKVRR